MGFLWDIYQHHGSYRWSESNSEVRWDFHLDELRKRCHGPMGQSTFNHWVSSCAQSGSDFVRLK